MVVGNLPIRSVLVAKLARSFIIKEFLAIRLAAVVEATDRPDRVSNHAIPRTVHRRVRHTSISHRIRVAGKFSVISTLQGIHLEEITAHLGTVKEGNFLPMFVGFVPPGVGLVDETNGILMAAWETDRNYFNSGGRQLNVLFVPHDHYWLPVSAIDPSESRFLPLFSEIIFC